jgi:hypothetical protein
MKAIDKFENRHINSDQLLKEPTCDSFLNYDEPSTQTIENEPNSSLTTNPSASRKLSALLSLPVANVTPTAKKPRFSFPTPSHGNTSESSCYFSQAKSNSTTKAQNSAVGKARVSGLLKKKNSQPNLLQVWSKGN